ncbi:hypothetical protein RFI_25194 [Reticulomyxa filosa]|uniref:Uncharacterized protein n=1 Tax=Reticulomyxa filosa TaxID=46433 RepID=X6MDT3_RETFI|nr:hypothetical protein RFI_25194 [Reticulomyxa filosa]|eukprot:ETO12178.1 hypothetical protein RFI_25194 [Reticulomyxa filosa]
MLKSQLEECVEKQQMSGKAAVYFAMLRYIRVDKNNQENWLTFHAEYLKVANRRTSQEVLIAHLQTILNVAKQMDFVGRKTNEIKVLNEIFEIVRKLSTSGKGRPVKKACYLLMLTIILRGPTSMYEKLQPFLENHVLNHLDEADKVGDALEMLQMLFEGTNNPFPFHEKRPINWLSSVRSDDDENAKKNHMHVVFKAFLRGKALKTMYHRHWHRCVCVFVHLCAQNLELAVQTLLPQLFDVRKSTVDQIVLGLDCVSEIVRLDGNFVRQHQPSPTLLSTLNDFLPTILWQAEQFIGVEKIGRRTQPLVFSDVVTTVTPSTSSPSVPMVSPTHYRLDKDKDKPESIDITRVKSPSLHRLPLFQDGDGDDASSLWWNYRNDPEEEKKSVVDEIMEDKKQDDAIIHHPAYASLTNQDLLKLAFIHNNSIAKFVLNARQKINDFDTLEEMVKKAKATSRKEYLQVLKACLRASLALRPSSILTDAKQGNKLYIGYLLLHPDYEIAQLALCVLIEVAKQEKFHFCFISFYLFFALFYFLCWQKLVYFDIIIDTCKRILLPRLLTELTNFILQFFIHEAFCISVLIQALSSFAMLVVGMHFVIKYFVCVAYICA